MATTSARSTLTAILAERGPDVLAQPRRVEALLSDLCPDQRRETRLLVEAQREGVPDELRASTTVPPPLLRARLRQRLTENLSVTDEAARWAVETWAIALVLLAESEAETGPSLRDSQRRQTPPVLEPHVEQAPPVTPQWQTPQPQPQAAQPQPQQWQTPQWQTTPQASQPVWPPPVAGTVGWQLGLNDSGTGAMAALPPQLRGFNWGALWLGWIWSIGNKSYIGLLALIPYVGIVMAIVLGVKGNEWAWQNRRWDSPEQFQATQKVWAIVGWVWFGICVVFAILALIGSTLNNNSRT